MMLCMENKTNKTNYEGKQLFLQLNERKTVNICLTMPKRSQFQSYYNDRHVSFFLPDLQRLEIKKKKIHYGQT